MGLGHLFFKELFKLFLLLVLAGLNQVNKVFNLPRQTALLVGEIGLFHFLGSGGKMKVILKKINGNKKECKNKKKKRPVHVNMLKELLFGLHVRFSSR